jgi:predicted lipid-binding transport protein (Tim44 family)
LLSDDVYQSFSRAIANRQAEGETQETHLVAIKSAEIVAAELAGRLARVTVRFVSDQINVTRSADGKVVDGEPDHAVEKIDVWTFARDVQSRDPNWRLAASKSS